MDTVFSVSATSLHTRQPLTFPDRTGLQTSLSLRSSNPYDKNTAAKYPRKTHVHEPTVRTHVCTACMCI